VSIEGDLREGLQVDGICADADGDDVVERNIDANLADFTAALRKRRRDHEGSEEKETGNFLHVKRSAGDSPPQSHFYLLRVAA
jgi:hypothetical protein